LLLLIGVCDTASACRSAVIRAQSDPGFEMDHAWTPSDSGSALLVSQSCLKMAMG